MSYVLCSRRNCMFHDGKLTEEHDLSSDFVMYVLRVRLASCNSIGLNTQVTYINIYYNIYTFQKPIWPQANVAKCPFPCQRPMPSLVVLHFFSLFTNPKFRFNKFMFDTLFVYSHFSKKKKK